MKATMPSQPRSAALALTLTLLAAGALLTACGGGDKAAAAKASAPQAAGSARQSGPKPHSDTGVASGSMGTTS